MKLLLLIVTISVFVLSIIALPPSGKILPPDFFINKSSPDQKVNVGGAFNLFCQITNGGSITDNDDWKYCTWTRLSDGAKCVSHYICVGSLCGIGVGEFHRETKCEGDLTSRAIIYGDNPNVRNQLCQISVINAGRKDNSDWECSIEQCQIQGCGTATGNGVFAKSIINVQVN